MEKPFQPLKTASCGDKDRFLKLPLLCKMFKEKFLEVPFPTNLLLVLLRGGILKSYNQRNSICFETIPIKRFMKVWRYLSMSSTDRDTQYVVSGCYCMAY